MISYVIGALFLGGVFFFDSSEKKRQFLGVSLFVTIFSLSIATAKELSYAPFFISVNGLSLWLLGTYFTKRKSSLLSGFAGVVFSFFSLVVLFRLLSIEQEIHVFLMIIMGWAMLPLVLERQYKEVDAEPWFPLLSLQTIIRLFCILWSSHHKHEILAIDLFKEISLLLVATASFVVFLGFLNWNTARWRFLYESFLTVFIVFCSLTGDATLAQFGVVLCLAHFLGGLEKNDDADLSSWEYSNKALQNGGFGGIGFWLSFVMIIRLADYAGGIETTFWCLLIFLIGWGAWSLPSVKINSEKPSTVGLKFKIFLQLSFGLCVLILLYSGGSGI